MENTKSIINNSQIYLVFPRLNFPISIEDLACTPRIISSSLSASRKEDLNHIKILNQHESQKRTGILSDMIISVKFSIPLKRTNTV